jgi:hypothetical protein
MIGLSACSSSCNVIGAIISAEIIFSLYLKALDSDTVCHWAGITSGGQTQLFWPTFKKHAFSPFFHAFTGIKIRVCFNSHTLIHFLLLTHHYYTLRSQSVSYYFLRWPRYLHAFVSSPNQTRQRIEQNTNRLFAPTSNLTWFHNGSFNTCKKSKGIQIFNVGQIK